ncbi:P-type conjugative transfer ATPase TrbB [Asticcacaulis machinosus]|uniref:P-type conjugative transfer ATPase TrbB n=1 Tax=Asticcacaulis machinosus TaxID=2984211 RepID=A0ABT5HG01_9CAUL|nr:P-type conjugative transfer ATPase TrbB [Asticcacaulis machinosus]MDC7675156.1 P-type conjugative transfer ATPase TrbB [Asticcacaulis machinosus]
MTPSPSARRLREMLRTAFGDAINAALNDPLVIEILVNPDGTVWLDRAGEGRVVTDVVLPPADRERIVRLVASHVAVEVHAEAPIVSAELPTFLPDRRGERFEGLLPPVVEGACFAIRKPASRVFTLGDYVSDGMLSSVQARLLRSAVQDRRNILIAGGTSSGKTTFANALLAEVAALNDRVVLIEDTRELQCAARDVVALRTRAGVASLSDLVRSTLRLRPDRIIVGEVRGGEALELLKAWNTGHPGGVATLHANSAIGALYRLEQLIQEAVVHVPRRLIADAVDVVVFIQNHNPFTRTPRRVEAVMALDGLIAEGDYRLRPLEAAET